MVKDCINKYYNYVSIITEPEVFYGELEETEIIDIKNDNAKILYNLLDEEYIQNKRITIENLVNVAEKVCCRC